MTTPRLLSILMLAMMVMTLTSCDAIAGIFKAGAWVGAIAIFFVVALIWWLVTKMGGGSNTPS